MKIKKEEIQEIKTIKTREGIEQPRQEQRRTTTRVQQPRQEQQRTTTRYNNQQATTTR